MATNKRPKRATVGNSRKSAAIREQILCEWRGTEEAIDLNAGVNPAGRFIHAILESAGLHDGIEEGTLRAAWKELAGDFIAAHTEPASIKGGHLLLRVTQPTMRFHLEQMKAMLLTRLKEKLGNDRIRSVKFTLG